MVLVVAVSVRVQAQKLLTGGTKHLRSGPAVAAPVLCSLLNMRQNMRPTHYSGGWCTLANTSRGWGWSRAMVDTVLLP